MSARWWTILLLLFPGLGVILLFIGAVLYMAVSQSLGLFNFAGTSEFTLQHWQVMLGRGRFWSAFEYSTYIAFWSSLLSVILAYPIALWLRKPFVGSNLTSAILKAPMLVHGLVAAFLLINVISFHGFINEFLIWVGVIEHPLRMQNDKNGIAVIFLQVWKQMPFAFLLLLGAVRSLPDGVLNAAQDLGANSLSRFMRITLPMTVKALQASLILIFIGAAADFSFQAVAGPVSKDSMSTFMSYTQSELGDWNGAAVIAVMLMLLSLLGGLIMAIIAKFIARIGTR